METSWAALNKLILVPGHAVYLGGGSVSAHLDAHWALNGFQRGEPPLYIDHARVAVKRAAAILDSLLIFSGGQTRCQAGPRSEGQSYWLLAEDFSWWESADLRSRATTEEFARDSFENLLFGIARFRECTGHYPACIEVVGWRFKEDRFHLHCRSIGWSSGDRFVYHGVNDPPSFAASVAGEEKVRAAFEADPFGSGPDLAEKRRRRNPFLRHHPYEASCPEIAVLLRHRTEDPRTFEGNLPWN